MREDIEKRLDVVQTAVKSAGFSLYTFLLAFLNTCNQHQSSQVSQILKYHGSELFAAMAARQLDVANDWMLSTIHLKVAAEAKPLTRYFRPDQQTPVSQILSRFSLRDVLHDAEVLAPTIYDLFQHIGLPDFVGSSGRNHNLVCAVTVFLKLQTNSGLDSCHFTLHAHEIEK